MDPQPISSAVAVERWAVDVLRGIADALEAAPRNRTADALTLLLPPLIELERVAALLELRQP